MDRIAFPAPDHSERILAAGGARAARLESAPMAHSEREPAAEGGSLELGEWLVHPDQNRISRPGASVQLEPRLMDLLVFLARRAGQVVSRDQLIEGVWKVEFITEWAITRAIAKLRRALGDLAGQPRYIETISKRGYRLLATVKVAAPPAPPERPARADARQAAVALPRPFAAGGWVRAERFYGRDSQLAEILDGPRDALWIVGTRAVGKTSLLRQVEHLTAAAPQRGYMPLVLDLEGVEDAAELEEDLSEALLDAAPRLSAAGIAPADVPSGDFFTSLGRLRRMLGARGLKLLLLVDEAEELLRLRERQPAVLRKLRRALQSREGIRTVLAASRRLWALAEPDGETSPFLHGFTPPVYLGPLTDAEARDLLRQAYPGPGIRPALDDETVEGIRTACGNHPYQLQALAARVLERGDLAEARAELEADPGLRRLFAVDLSLLDEDERDLVRCLAEGDEATARAPGAAGRILEMERLGLLRRRPDGGVAIASHFLSRWLDSRP
ncbi:MAG: winged helix-turn-helix domain-containing protein [Holophagales bacterium]|nr:winged helix-turn-helix domain-containing protein [Holophagales bacterium]